MVTRIIVSSNGNITIFHFLLFFLIKKAFLIGQIMVRKNIIQVQKQYTTIMETCIILGTIHKAFLLFPNKYEPQF